MLRFAMKNVLKNARLLPNAGRIEPMRGFAADKCNDGPGGKKKERPPGVFPNGTTTPDANDLPVPEGDWYQAYSAKNNKYMAFMGSGFLAMVTAMYMFFTNEGLDMNFFVPDLDEDHEEEDVE